jgi:hypothetical protein
MDVSRQEVLAPTKVILRANVSLYDEQNKVIYQWFYLLRALPA